MHQEHFISRLLERVESLLPKQIMPQELQNTLKAVLKESLSKWDLVTREEFDIQNEVLHKTRQQLTQLEQQVKMLEQQKI